MCCVINKTHENSAKEVWDIRIPVITEYIYYNYYIICNYYIVRRTMYHIANFILSTHVQYEPALIPSLTVYSVCVVM